MSSFHQHRQEKKSAFTLIELLVVISIIGILLSLTLNGVSAARESSRRMTCSSRLRQQALALHSFHAIHQSFPLGEDRWLYHDQSWSSAILAQLEQPAIAEQWDRSVAWDDPAGNEELGKRTIPLFRCPSSILDSPGDTDYAGIRGSFLAALPSVIAHSLNNGVLISSTPVRMNPVSLTEIFDGSSQTAFLAEVADRLPAEHGLWADGGNVISHDNGGINLENSGEIFSFHPGGAHVAMADGAVHFLTESVAPQVIGAMCSRDGREDLNDFFTD